MKHAYIKPATQAIACHMEQTLALSGNTNQQGRDNVVLEGTDKAWSNTGWDDNEE